MWSIRQILAILLLSALPHLALQATDAQVPSSQVQPPESASSEKYCSLAADTSREECSYEAAREDLPDMLGKDVCGEQSIHTQNQVGQCRLHASQSMAPHACKALMHSQRDEPSQRHIRNCTSYCCDLKSEGEWHSTADGVMFKPQSRCMYHSYSREEALLCLSKQHKTRIVIIGDSLWRQLYMRLVYFVRQPTFLIDHTCHFNSRYGVCETHDNIEHSGVSETVDAPGWEKRFQETFGQRSALEGLCRINPIEVHFLWAQHFDRQISRIQTYLELFPKSASEKLLFIIGAPGFWALDEQTVPLEYFDMLDTIPQRVSQAYIMGVPTLHVQTVEQQHNLQLRNEQLKQWVTESPSDRMQYFDYDTFARADNAPANLMFHDWHYMCHWDFMGCNSHSSLMPTQDCNCQDDMNLAIWQGIFNSFCNNN